MVVRDTCPYGTGSPTMSPHDIIVDSVADLSAQTLSPPVGTLAYVLGEPVGERVYILKSSGWTKV